MREGEKQKPHDLPPWHCGRHWEVNTTTRVSLYRTHSHNSHFFLINDKTTVHYNHYWRNVQGYPEMNDFCCSKRYREYQCSRFSEQDLQEWRFHRGTILYTTMKKRNCILSLTCLRIQLLSHDWLVLFVKSKCRVKHTIYKKDSKTNKWWFSK